MLNGRCNTASDFTSISVKGVVVVDYVIVNQDVLHICTGIEIISATDLFQNDGLRGRCNPEHNISDHSVLCWQFHINHFCLSEHLPEAAQYVVRYDVSEIPVDFMCDQKTVHDLTVLSAHDTNDSYSRFCNTVKCNMNEHLPSKHVRISGEKRNYHHTLKPWWTTQLNDLWSIRCTAHNLLCKCNFENKRDCEDRFKEAQHSFDGAVKEAKRQYWYDQQKHLLSINQNSEFWKTMGNVGISTATSVEVSISTVIEHQ